MHESRHPAHRLYDSACELLAAAQEARTAARRHDTGEAIPATLGCMAAATEEMAVATSAIAEELRRTQRLDGDADAVFQALDRTIAEFIAAAQACDTVRSQLAGAVHARRGPVAPG